MEYLNKSLINLSTISYNDVREFSLHVNENGNFISNGRIKINCSNLVTSVIDGEIFFSVKFTPDGIPLHIPYRLFDILFYDKIAESILNIVDAKNFVQNFIKSFSCNDWFSLAWISRLIAKTKLKVEDKANLMYETDTLNIIQLVTLAKNDIINLSNEKLFKIIPYELSPTSTKIMSLSDITNVFKEKFFDFNSMISYFNVPDEIIMDITELDVADSLNITFFNIDLYNIELREQIYKKMDKIRELNEDIFNFFFIRFREIENELRYKKGYNSVGSLFTESLLYNKIKNEFPEFQVLSQFSPTWLSPQRFDIFIKDKNCAIEYNGIQHYQPIDYFGGKDGFNRTKKRDITKRKKCKVNNCYLIEIKYDEDFDMAIKRISSIINLFP